MRVVTEHREDAVVMPISREIEQYLPSIESAQRKWIDFILVSFVELIAPHTNAVFKTMTTCKHLGGNNRRK